MKTINMTFMLLALVASLMSASSLAQGKPEWVEVLPEIDGDPVAGRTKAVPCGACHGAEGISAHNYFPNLAGQKEEYLLYQMHRYRSGKRPHELMGPLTQSLTDIDIADLSAFYASIKIIQVTEDEVDQQ